MFRMSTRRYSENRNCSLLNPLEKNWPERFVEISTHICFGDYDVVWFEDIHLDILKDLCNECLDDNVSIQLLSLLEQLVILFDSADK